VVGTIRAVMAELPADCRPDRDEIANAVVARLEKDVLAGARPIINATGTVLHTNLGRAPLSPAAVEAISRAAGYTDLEHDLHAGVRGSRQDQVEPLLKLLLGAEAAIMVSNNAAALLLSLAAVCPRKEIIVSRGQAIEIGDGFRLPAIVRESRARLVEVGTTNRTTVEDYVEAVTPRTAGFLHVHTSNFRIVGFTGQPSIAELAGAAHAHDLVLLDDNGSGPLVDTARLGLAHEPMPAEALASGADIVTFSTDKLLGGPQGGIIAGRRDLLTRVRRHPLARAVRPDKLAIAALRATLELYATDNLNSIPVLAMLAADLRELEERAHKIIRTVEQEESGHHSQNRQRKPNNEKCGAARLAVERSESMVGGGSLPQQTMATVVIAITPADGASAVARRLRALPVPIVARVHKGKVLLDLRTVAPEHDSLVASGLLTVGRLTAQG